MRAATRVALLIAPLLPCAKCVESPVEESLEVRFLANGSAEVVARVELHRPDDAGREVADRLDRWARDLEDRRDPWSRRVVDAAPQSDEENVERVEGRVVAVTRTAHFDDREALDRLFRDTAVTTAYRERDGTATWELHPSAGTAVTVAERRRTTREVEAWAAKAARYLRAEHALWRHLDANPDAAPACFAAIDAESADGLEPLEASLVTEAIDSMREVWGAIFVEEGKEDTLEERTNRAFDPFPARLLVRVDGEILEREGFVDGPDGALSAPRTGVWESFLGLEGRWVEPDLALAMWRDAQDERGLRYGSAERFAALPRRISSTAPTEGEVTEAILAALRPAPVYRVLWKRSGEETGNAGEGSASGTGE